MKTGKPKPDRFFRALHALAAVLNGGDNETECDENLSGFSFYEQKNRVRPCVDLVHCDRSLVAED